MYKEYFVYVAIGVVAGMIVFYMVFTYNFKTQIMQGDVEPGYLCLTFDGRLGNHIWQYASIYSIAKLNNFTIILGERDDLVEFFEVSSAEIRPKRDVCDSFIEKYTEFCCTFYEDMLHIPNNASYKLGKFLQSWRYFADTFGEVRKELSFKEWLREPSKQTIANVRQLYSTKYSTNDVTVVGIHLRRGDIVSPDYNDAGVYPAPDEYVYRAIDYMLDKFKHVVFIVCSNGMDYAKTVTLYRNITAHYFHMKPIQDMALLASTDHVITTVGSYGWWAGFLSGGTVIYLKNPLEEGSESRMQYNYYDYYPPEWIALE